MPSFPHVEVVLLALRSLRSLRLFVVLEAARGSFLLPRILHVPGAGLGRRIDVFFLVLQFQQLRLVVAVTGGDL